MSEYIYLLQEREFIKLNENIYKIGRTSKNNLTRFNQYPKGSDLKIQLKCDNSIYIERELIKIFNDKYIKRKDIGNEYFEGNYKSMMIDIIDFIKDNELIQIHTELIKEKEIRIKEDENKIIEQEIKNKEEQIRIIQEEIKIKEELKKLRDDEINQDKQFLEELKRIKDENNIKELKRIKDENDKSIIKINPLEEFINETFDKVEILENEKWTLKSIKRDEFINLYEKYLEDNNLPKNTLSNKKFTETLKKTYKINNNESSSVKYYMGLILKKNFIENQNILFRLFNKYFVKSDIKININGKEDKIDKKNKTITLKDIWNTIKEDDEYKRQNIRDKKQNSRDELYGLLETMFTIYNDHNIGKLIFGLVRKDFISNDFIDYDTLIDKLIDDIQNNSIKP